MSLNQSFGVLEDDEIPGLCMRTGPTHRAQLLLAAMVVTGVFGLLALRLYRIQIVRHAELSDRVATIITGSDVQRGRRGDIETRDGTILAREVVRYIVALDPGRIPTAKDATLLQVAAQKLGLSDAQRRKTLARLKENRDGVARGTARPLRFLPLERGVNEETANAWREALSEHLDKKELVGLIRQKIHFREYPEQSFFGTSLGATKMGRTSAEISGLCGLELKLDAYLAGWDGHRRVVQDGVQRSRFVWASDVDIPSVSGCDVILTIDSRFQSILEDELEKAVVKKSAAAGLGIVISCRNGDILALANYPSLDPNQIQNYPSEEMALRSRIRAVQNQYEPGSTIKPFWAAGAIEAGLVRPDQLIWKGGRGTRILGRWVEDVSDHGPLTVADAVIYSSNIGMSIVGLKLGRDRMLNLLDRFHFQERTGVPLPGEAIGLRRERKNWSEKYTTISASFGYALSVTPIQLVAAYSSLVNGGRYYRPRLVEKIRCGGEIQELPVDELGQSIRPDTSRTIRDILYRQVEEGTGKRWRIKGFPFGGKTGTAAISKGREGYLGGGGKEYLSSFVAFAPYPDPDFAMLVMIERPRGLYYGSTVCGPVIHGFLKRAYRIPDGGLLVREK